MKLLSNDVPMVMLPLLDVDNAVMNYAVDAVLVDKNDADR